MQYMPWLICIVLLQEKVLHFKKQVLSSGNNIEEILKQHLRTLAKHWHRWVFQMANVNQWPSFLRQCFELTIIAFSIPQLFTDLVSTVKRIWLKEPVVRILKKRPRQHLTQMPKILFHQVKRTYCIPYLVAMLVTRGELKRNYGII